MFSAEDLDSMQWVRLAFDPLGRANPGKIFPTPQTCGESMRRSVQLQAEGRSLPEEVIVY
jgi:glycolate oxidase